MPRIIVTADPVFTIEPCSKSETANIFQAEGIDLDKPIIGFSVRKWDGYKNYTGIIASIADYVAETYGVMPVFLPMQHPNDLLMVESIVSRMKHKGFIIKNRYNASQVLGIISRMDLLVGMRLHALIFAVSLGIPVVGLVYEPKVEWFLEYIGLKQLSAGDVKTLEYGNLKSIVDYAWENKSSIKDYLQSITPGLKEKSIKNAEIAINVLSSCNFENGFTS